MAYLPPGSVQTECTRLPVMLRTKKVAFFVKEQ